MAGVPLTDLEWNAALALYPNLVNHRADCLKTDGPTGVYNCIAWSVGSTTEWISPPQPRAAFEAFYATRGFVTCPAGEATADGYALANGEMTHGSRFLGGVWSSKRGQNMRMTHPRLGLTNSVGYGNIVVSFKPNPILTTAEFQQASNPVSSAEDEADPATVVQIAALVQRSADNFPALANTFGQNWDAWQKTWFNKKGQNLDSDTPQVNSGPEWTALVNMGASILPQVVEKLKSPANIFGCDLYNTLQTDPKKKVSPKDLNNYWVLNNQAKQIVKLYGMQVAEFTNFADGLIAHQTSPQVSESSSMEAYTSGPDYEALRDMRLAAVPLIMDRYATEQDGWWHELLHEIVHERPSGAQSFRKPELYQHWSTWHQNKPVAAPAAE